MVEQITGMLSSLKIELKSVFVKGFPKKEHFNAIDKLTDEILNRHKVHE